MPKQLFVLRAHRPISSEMARNIGKAWEDAVRDTALEGSKLLVLDGGSDIVPLSWDADMLQDVVTVLRDNQMDHHADAIERMIGR